MARVLVLGGTAWLGREVARASLARGDDVTCLARGEAGEVPDGARHVRADRSAPGAYDEVRDSMWDAIIDVSWQPRFVAEAVDALGQHASHWTYVSSVSVYARDDVVGTDEAAARVDPLLHPTAELSDYSGAKVRCEDLVMSGLGDRALLARAGLIVGPGDPTDRFGYWVGRLALAAHGPVLVPDEPTLPTQVIDVRDLALWIAGAAANGAVGAVNAVGRPDRFDALLSTATDVSGYRGDLVRAQPGWLVENDVRHWSGPRSLPLWLPLPENAGSMTRSDARAAELGLRRRSLTDTLVDTLVDERERGLGRDRRAGLTRAEELALIDGMS